MNFDPALPVTEPQSVAIVTYDFDNGGTSRVALYLANGLQDAGCRVAVVACTSSGEMDAAYRARLHDGVQYVAFRAGRPKSRAVGEILAFRAFRAWLKSNRPDIVLGTSNNISWFTGLGVALAGGKRSRLYIKTTNPIIRAPDPAWLTRLRKIGYGKLFRAADGVLPLSEGEADILRGHFPAAADKFRVVFNPYATAAFFERDLDVSPRQGSKSRTILAVGRLEKQKNMGRMLDAFALARLPDTQLLIAGNGPEHEELLAQARRLGIADQVRFLGFVDNVPELLAMADLFVLSSNYEGLPAVVFEALASGCPVVSTDCFPGAAELLAPLPGCAATDKTPEALADAMLASLAMERGAQALRAAARDYTVESSVASHIRSMV